MAYPAAKQNPVYEEPVLSAAILADLEQLENVKAALKRLEEQKEALSARILAQVEPYHDLHPDASWSVAGTYTIRVSQRRSPEKIDGNRLLQLGVPLGLIDQAKVGGGMGAPFLLITPAKPQTLPSWVQDDRAGQ